MTSGNFSNFLLLYFIIFYWLIKKVFFINHNMVIFYVYIWKVISCTEKVIYLPVFSPKYLSSPLNSFASCLIVKWQSYIEPLWNTIGISFGVLYLKLQMLWAAPLNVPVSWQWSLTLWYLDAFLSFLLVLNSFSHM